MVLVFHDVVDIGRRETIAPAIIHLPQGIAALVDAEQSLARGAQVEIAVVGLIRPPDGDLAVEGFHVVTRIHELASGIVVSQDAIHADGQQDTLVGLQESHHRTVWRLYILDRGGMQFAHLHAGDGGGLMPHPQRVVVVVPNHGDMSMRIALPQLRLTGHHVAPCLDDIDAEACRADDDIAMLIFLQAENASNQLVGKGIAHETVSLVVIAAQSLHAAHPQAVLAVLKKTSHIVVDKRSGVVLVEKVLRETITVETVEAILGGHPDIATMVLQDVPDRRARQLVGREQPTAHRLCSQQEGQRQAEYEKTIQKV